MLFFLRDKEFSKRKLKNVEKFKKVIGAKGCRRILYDYNIFLSTPLGSFTFYAWDRKMDFTHVNVTHTNATYMKHITMSVEITIFT